jgi:hypothetical protein
MEIWKILNEFKVFNLNMEEFYQFYGYLQHYHGSMEVFKRFYGFYHGNMNGFKRI